MSLSFKGRIGCAVLFLTAIASTSWAQVAVRAGTRCSLQWFEK